MYKDKGAAANESYKYLQPALSRTDAVLQELNSDQRLFRGFITSSARRSPRSPTATTTSSSR